MKNVFAQTFPAGQPVATVYSITLVNNIAKTQDVTVPDDSLWALQSIKAVNGDDVQRVVSIYLYKEAAKTSLINRLETATIAVGSIMSYPSGGTSQNSLVRPGYPLLLGPGNTISVVWSAGGASAGGTDADGLVVFYRKLSLG